MNIYIYIYREKERERERERKNESWICRETIISVPFAHEVEDSLQNFPPCSESSAAWVQGAILFKSGLKKRQNGLNRV